MSKFSFKKYLRGKLKIKEQARIIASDNPQVPFLAKIGKKSNAHQAKFSGLNIINDGVYVQDKVSFGYATTVGNECWLRGPIEIGNYCQLGPRVCIHATDHTAGHITTYNGSGLLNGMTKKFIKYDMVVLGHGVWCGYGSVILKGVCVGNGAIIGAGAIVTKDVPAYHIVAGNPARIIKSRFTPQICELMEKSKWWEAKSEKLDKYAELFAVDFNVDEERGINLLQQFIMDQG